MDEGDDDDPVNVDMSTIVPVVRPKIEIEKHVLKQLKTFVTNHSTYIWPYLMLWIKKLQLCRCN